MPHRSSRRRSRTDDLCLIRSDSDASIDTNATAANLPGAGRTLGLLLDYLGSNFESFMNRLAPRLGLGPEEVAKEICRLRRHHETSIAERHSVQQSNGRSNGAKERVLLKLCKKLLKYARYVIRTLRFGYSQTLTDPTRFLHNSLLSMKS